MANHPTRSRKVRVTDTSTTIYQTGGQNRRIRIGRRTDGSYVRSEWDGAYASDETISPTEAMSFLRGALDDARRYDDLDRRNGLKYPFDGSGSAEWRVTRIERTIAEIEATI